MGVVPEAVKPFLFGVVVGWFTAEAWSAWKQVERDMSQG